MAEKRSRRFKAVLMLAEREEQEVVTRLGRFREQLQLEQQQLAQLREYSQDYINTINTRRTGVRSSEMISYRTFLRRLSDAEEEQVEKVSRMLEELENIQQQWRQKYQYRRSIEDLIERFLREETAELETKLQRELDELAAQSLYRPPNS